MADHAPNYTARYRVRYFTGQANHSQTWRYPGNGDGPELLGVQNAVYQYYAALQDKLWDDFAILSASYCLRGSDIFLPTSGPSVSGQVDPSVLRRAYHKANALSFPGRSALGKRAIIYQYGFTESVGDEVEADDFRLTVNEDLVINACVTALQAAASDLVANDGEAVTWYPYANIGENDYWKGKVRNG